MAKKLIVSTEFKAVDGMTSVLGKMTAGVRSFSNTALTAFARTERAARKLATGSQNLSDKIFNLRNAAGVLAAGFAVKKVYDMATGTAKLGDEAAKTSRLMGLSAEALQEFRFAADRQGVSTETLDKSFLGLQKRIGELKFNTGSLYTFLNKTGNSALMKQLKGAKSTEEAFNILQKAISGIKDPTIKAAYATSAFGRSGIDMLKLFEAGTEGIQGLRDEARKYGGVIGNDAANASEAFIDAQTNMNFALSGLKNVIGVALMPKVKELIERITIWIGNNKELIKGKITKFVESLGKGIEFVVNNSDKLITGLKILIGLFVGLKVATIAFNTVSTIAAAAQWALNVAMNANPIGIIITVIGLLIAAIAALIIYWEEIVNWVKTSDNWFAQIVRTVVNGLVIAFQTLAKIIGWVSGKISALIEWVKTSDSWFAKFVRGAINGLIIALQTLGDVFDWIWNKIKTAWEMLMGFFDLVGEIGSSIADFFGGDDNQDISLEQKKLSAIAVTNGQTPAGIQASKIQTNNSKVDININDRSGSAEIARNTGANVKLTKTLGWQ